MSSSGSASERGDVESGSASASESEDELLQNFFLSVDESNLAVFGKRTSKRTRTELDTKPRVKASTPGWDDDEKSGARTRLPIKNADGVLRQQDALPPAPDGDGVSGNIGGADGGKGKDGSSAPASKKQRVQDGQKGAASRAVSKEDNDDSNSDDGSEVSNRIEDDDHDASESYAAEARAAAAAAAASAKLSPAELVARRQARCRQIKTRIAELCESILESPQDALVRPRGATAAATAASAVGPDGVAGGSSCGGYGRGGGKRGPPLKMEELLSLVADHDAVVQQLAALSALAIFRDIIPAYRLRLPTEKERSQKVSKQVQQVRSYEAALLSNYQSYLKSLDALVRTMPGARRDGGVKSAWSPSSTAGFASASASAAAAAADAGRRAAGLCAVRCMCGVLEAHPHFNFRSNLVAAVVPRLSHADPEARRACYECLERLFAADAQGETSLEVVRAVAKFLRARRFCVHVEALRVLETLPLRVHEDEAGAVRAKAKRMKRGRRRPTAEIPGLNGGDDGVEAALAESRAAADPIVRARAQADALHEVTLVYFRFLKDAEARTAAASARLLPAVLEGLGRVAHLVNLDTVVDLMAALRELLAAGQLTLAGGLACVLVALRTLHGPGRELQVDEKAFLLHLYGLLGRLGTAAGGSGSGGGGRTGGGARSGRIATLGGEAAGLTALACDCVEAAFIKRKELSAARVAATLKRLCAAAVRTSSAPDAARLLGAARQLALRYPVVRQLLDGGGDRVVAGAYNPDAEDPEAGNPLAATCWELGLLRHSPDEAVTAAVRALTLLGTRAAADALALGVAGAAGDVSGGRGGSGRSGGRQLTFLDGLTVPDARKLLAASGKSKRRRKAAAGPSGADGNADGAGAVGASETANNAEGAGFWAKLALMAASVAPAQQSR